jgi:hypothetical protein
MDGIHKSKLVKTAYLTKALPKGTVYPDITVPETMSYYEIKVSNFLSSEQKDSIISKFENDWKKLGYDKGQ